MSCCTPNTLPQYVFCVPFPSSVEWREFSHVPGREYPLQGTYYIIDDQLLFFISPSSGLWPNRLSKRNKANLFCCVKYYPTPLGMVNTAPCCPSFALDLGPSCPAAVVLNQFG